MTNTTLVLIGLITLNSLIFSNGNAGVGILAVDFIVLLLVSILLKKQFNSKLTRNIYLWSNILTISFLMWSTSSPHYAVVLPVFILIASHFLNTKTFFIISAYCILNIVLFGLMKVNNWGIESSTLSFGYWQMIDVIIILYSAIYTAWQASKDMKYTLRNLKLEIEKVTNSRSEIANLVHFDALTGLENQYYCEKQYAKLFKKMDIDIEQIAVFFLDLDNFKSINDYYNHSVGDKLLVTISKRLKGLVKDEDIACRLSGDEFVLIIHRPKNYNLHLFASRILRRISKPIEINSALIDITASVGIATANKDDD